MTACKFTGEGRAAFVTALRLTMSPRAFARARREDFAQLIAQAEDAAGHQNAAPYVVIPSRDTVSGFPCADIHVKLRRDWFAATTKDNTP